MKKLRFGMVGGGNGAFIGDVHRHGAIMDNLAVLVAGAFSRNMEKSLECAREWGVEDESRVYPDYETMAREESKREDGIDFVSIVTPNNSHYEIAKCFMEHGIHIVCDKPLALKTEEGLELEAMAKEKGLLFGVTYTYTGYAMIRQARELIAAGEIGKITTIYGEYPQEWLAVSLIADDSEQAVWRHDPNVSGESGCCADIGTHVEAVISKMTGLHPKKVIARFDHIPEKMKLETNSMVICEFDDGVPGMIWTSQIAMGHETELNVRIFGEKGSVEWSHLAPWELRVTKINEPPVIYTANRDYLHPAAKDLCRLPSGHIEGFYEAFGNIYRGFCENLIALKEGRNPGYFTYPTVSDGVMGLRFVDACLKSSRNDNVWVEL